MTAKQPFLSVSNISATYGQQDVVKNVSFDIEEGQLTCLLGPSGCGKTTILRAISGFQDLKSGSITLGGNLLCDAKNSIAPEHRNVGMVFQDHALFPHLSIIDNVGFGLKSLKGAKKLSKADQRNRILELLDLVGMADHKDKYPHELSGGQSQRVALARAIAPQPKLLLMDEPFSNLDTELREVLGYEVRELLKKLNITAIMVTHDQHDAFALGDKIGVMSDGQLMQWDNSFNLYHAPANRFVANFIGDGVFIKGNIPQDNIVLTDLGEIQGQVINKQLIGQDVELLLRPDDIKYSSDNTIQGKIIRKAFKGAQTLYTIETTSASTLMSLVPSHDNYQVGDMIGLNIDAEHLVCFSREA